MTFDCANVLEYVVLFFMVAFTAMCCLVAVLAVISLVTDIRDAIRHNRRWKP